MRRPSQRIDSLHYALPTQELASKLEGELRSKRIEDTPNLTYTYNDNGRNIFRLALYASYYLSRALTTMEGLQLCHTATTDYQSSRSTLSEHLATATDLYYLYHFNNDHELYTNLVATYNHLLEEGDLDEFLNRNSTTSANQQFLSKQVGRKGSLIWQIGYDIPLGPRLIYTDFRTNNWLYHALGTNDLASTWGGTERKEVVNQLFSTNNRLSLQLYRHFVFPRSITLRLQESNTYRLLDGSSHGHSQWLFHPYLRLTYDINERHSLSYNLQCALDDPSVSQLGSSMANRLAGLYTVANPDLKTSIDIRNQLSYEFQSDYLCLQLTGFFQHIHHSIEECFVRSEFDHLPVYAQSFQNFA